MDYIIEYTWRYIFLQTCSQMLFLVTYFEKIGEVKLWLTKCFPFKFCAISMPTCFSVVIFYFPKPTLNNCSLSISFRQNVIFLLFSSLNCYQLLKVHFVVHSFIPPFFSKKVEIFIPVHAFRYILFVLKIFLA